MTFWTIETTAKPGVVHLAPEGTTDALCSATPARGSSWRTPPKAMRGARLCANCVVHRDRADLARRAAESIRRAARRGPLPLPVAARSMTVVERARYAPPVDDVETRQRAEVDDARHRAR